MEKTQLKKFLFMFVIGLSLLFSYSNAEEFELNTVYTSPTNPTNNMTALTLFDSTTSLSDGYDLIYKYINDTETYKAEFNKLIQSSLDYYSCTHYVLVVKNGYTYLVLYNSLDIDIAMFGQLGFTPYAEYYRFVDNHSSTSTSNSAYHYKHTGPGLCTVANINKNEIIFLESNDFIKETTYSAGKFYMSGNYYYEPVSTEPDGPVFETTLTDDEIASVVNNFTSSMHWQNRDSVYNNFFIQYDNGTEGKYLLVSVSDYMYKYLSGLYIPAGVSSVDYEELDYDTYSVLYNDGVSGTFFPWQTDRFNYKLYTSLDGVNFDFLREMDCKDFNKYRWNMNGPIIYSNFYLPFKTLLGNTTNSSGTTINNYSDEVDLKFSELTNSETGENYIFEGLEEKSNEESNPIIAKISQLFKDFAEIFKGFIEILIDQIFNFSDMLVENYGENIVTLVFAILIKTVTVLVSSIALIFRAVTFILSLITIPASSALLSVDVVANSTGLSFTGLNWGTRFIEGLNMLKSLSWNGLGLWTLFETFVSALEIILFVKIVKKHYSSTL